VTYASPPAADASQLALWPQRVGAYLIDIAIPVVLLIIGSITGSTVVYLLFALVALGVSVYNRWIQMGTTGQSWGKKALGLKLISESTGEPIGPLMAFVRDICHFVDEVICYIGFLFPLWDAKRQTLADKIMSTLVITV